MKDLPKLNSYIRRFGIKPEHRGYNEKYTMIGFDTETIGNNDINVENDLYSIQVVKNTLDEEYFYLPSKDEVGIDMLDWKTETGNYLFNRYSYVTAHNVEFDLGALLGKDFLDIVNYRKYKENKIKVLQGNVYYKGWKIKFAMGQSSFFQFRKKGCKIIFSDSMNWFKGSLDSIGETFFNMGKLPKPKFLGIRPPKTDEEFIEFREYAMQDARIQFLITKEIIKLHQNENVSPCITPASFSFKVFRKKFLKDRIFLSRSDLALKFIWSTYHGARFESIGRGFFHKKNMYDVNSLYPFSMVKSPLNFSNQEYQQITLNDVEDGYVGFCKVKFKYDEDVMYPGLPVRSEKLTFPLSSISYCTTPELISALKQGVDIQESEIIGWYPKHEDIDHPLKHYVEYKYKEKQQLADELEKCKDDPKEYTKIMMEYLKTKLQLNTSYGKFAQRNKLYDIDKEKNIEVAGASFKPDFASLITGYSRKVIHDYMREFKALYCDTDSIITSKKLESNLELGGMKIEFEKLDFSIIRTKLYFGIEDDKVIKSAKHGFRIGKQDVYDLLKKYGNRDSIKYKKRRMTKALESLRTTRPSHSKPRKWVNDPFEITLKEDGKRIFGKSLNTAKELLTDQTLSVPLPYVKSIY